MGGAEPAKTKFVQKKNNQLILARNHLNFTSHETYDDLDDDNLDDDGNDYDSDDHNDDDDSDDDDDYAYDDGQRE